MSIRVSSMVWAADLPSAPLKLVLLSMADRADDNGGRLWPSMADTAERCSMSPQQARRHVHTLIDAGFLSVVGNPKGGRNLSARYQINLDRLASEMPCTKAATAESVSLGKAHIDASKGCHTGPERLSHRAERVSPVREETSETTSNGHKPLPGGAGVSGQGAGIGLTASPPQAAPLGVKAPEGVPAEVWVKLAERKAHPFTSAGLAALADQVSSALAGGESPSDVELRLLSLLSQERSHWKALPRAETPAARATPGRTYERAAKARKSPAAIAHAIDRNHREKDYS